MAFFCLLCTLTVKLQRDYCSVLKEYVEKWDRIVLGFYPPPHNPLIISANFYPPPQNPLSISDNLYHRHTMGTLYLRRFSLTNFLLQTY